MIRQSFIYLVMSIIIVLFAKHVHHIVIYIDMLFTYVNVLLTPIFSKTGWGLLIRKIIILAALPIIIVGIPALIYRAVKAKEMPHLIPAVWIVWVIIVLSDILIR